METRKNFLTQFYWIVLLAVGLAFSVSCLEAGVEKSLNTNNYPLTTNLQFDGAEQLWLKDHPRLRIGALRDWAPFDFRSTNNVQQGITADYLELLEKRLNISIEIHSFETWVEVMTAAGNREIDLVASIVKTPDRQKFLRFTSPYFSCPYVTVTRRMDKQVLHGIQDLTAQTVAIERGFYLHKRLEDDYPNIKRYTVNTTLEALQSVASEKADAYIGNRAVVSWMIEKEQLVNLKIASYTHFAPTQLRFGVRKDWPELCAILNKTLSAITDQEHLTIQRKWLGGYDERARSTYQHIVINALEQAWLESLGPLRLGIDTSWAPLEFMDQEGNHRGFSSDYMKRFTQQLGLEVAPIERMEWVEVLEKVREKKVDIVPMVEATVERRKYLNFTEPYIDYPIVVFTRQDSSLITGLKDILGKRLVVAEGFITTQYLKEDYPKLQLLEVPTTLDALREVAFGRADAFVGNLVTGSYLINQEGLTNLRVAAPTPYRSLMRIGVRNDWPHMVALLNRAITRLTEEDNAAIRNNWMPIQYEKRVDYGLLWKVVGGTLVLMALLLFRHRDIGRRNAELDASQKQFKALINTLPITVVVIKEDGEIIFSNPHACSEFGGGNSLTARNHRDFYADEEDRRYMVEQLNRGEEVVGHHVRFIIDSGECLESLVSAIPIRFDDQEALLAVAINVTDQVKIENNLKKAKIRAEEADHLKSAFLASMSHELRTPLNSIIGFTGILLQELAGPLNGEQRKQLSMVQGSSRHLLTLINDVLDISKIEAGELKIALMEFDLKDSLERVAELLMPQALQKGLELRVIAPEQTLPIISDQRRFEQVLINIIGNGLKFTDKGHVTVTCQHQGGRLVLEVEDTGPGIRKEDMGKLFKTFQQIDSGVNRIHEGTGLGLSISKKLIQMLGGELTAKSQWQTGTVFTIELPLSPP